MTPGEFTIVFVLGVLSSAHCVAMCGPIVLSYSIPMRGPRLPAHAAYNAGRILTYMLLGAIAGAAGHAAGFLGELAGLASGARILAGAAMVAAGIIMIRVTTPNLFVQIQQNGGTRRFSRAIGALLMSREARHKFGLGLILGFLPCGLVYAALLKSLESAGAVPGALTMLAFGLGTASALLPAGILSSLAGARLGNWTNRVAGVALLVFGAILLWRGILSKPVCHG